MSDKTPQCVECDRSNEEVPLMEIRFRDEVSWICPQHLPILIHKPEKLIGKLPGAEHLTFEGH
jgi:hypothetical protein